MNRKWGIWRFQDDGKIMNCHKEVSSSKENRIAGQLQKPVDVENQYDVVA